MSWLDLVLVAVLAAFAANGVMQGFIRQIASLVGFLLGLSLASALYSPLAARFAPTVDSEITLGPLIFAGILLGVWGLVSLGGIVLRKRSRKKDSNWPDDLGGALLGLASGVVVLAMLLAGMAGLDRSFARQVEDSRLGARLLDVTWEIMRALPAWLSLPAWLR
jgi:membrane protein required for colicin V production